MWKTIGYIIGGIMLLSLITAPFRGEDEAKPEPVAAVTTTTATTTPEETATPVATPTAKPKRVKPKPTPKPKPISAKQRVKNSLSNVDASGYVGVVDVQKVMTGSDGLDVYATTPEGGLEGPSVEDLDNAAGALFAAAYGEANWRKGMRITFRGGLVDTSTGEKDNTSPTGIYHMDASSAKRIDWDDTDTVKYVIEWSNYGTFAHPALKQD